MLSPFNPRYHLELAEVMFSLDNAADARRNFAMAVKLTDGKLPRAIMGLSACVAATSGDTK